MSEGPGFETVVLEHEGTSLRGLLALPEGAGPHPAVLVMHNAFGQGRQVRDAAARLAKAGYAALATDLYGGGAYSEDHGAVAEMIRPLRECPSLQRDRIVTWYRTLKGLANVNPERVGAIGYCFGGECVLELARSGADAKVIVSYHGLLATAKPAEAGGVRAHVAIFTGRRDPHVPRQDVQAVRDEMIAAGASWQITEFGDAGHAFTDTEANTPNLGRAYDLVGDSVSWAATRTLLETFIG